MKKKPIIGFIVALEEEFADFLIQIDTDIVCYQINEVVKIYEFIFQNTPCVACITGVGKAQAAMGTTLLMSYYDPKILVNYGTSGLLNKVLKVGDVIIVDSVFYGDVNLTGFGYVIGQHSKQPPVFYTNAILNKHFEKIATMFSYEFDCYKGSICCMDTFLDNTNEKELLLERFNLLNNQLQSKSLPLLEGGLLANDMESAAVIQTANQLKAKVPIVIIKAISDNSDENSVSNHVENLKLCGKNLMILLRQFVATVGVGLSKK